MNLEQLLTVSLVPTVERVVEFVKRALDTYDLIKDTNARRLALLFVQIVASIVGMLALNSQGQVTAGTVFDGRFDLTLLNIMLGFAVGLGAEALHFLIKAVEWTSKFAEAKAKNENPSIT